MQRIAIIGTGPTGLYTLAALIDGQAPLAITLYEAGEHAGVGMPYDEHANHRAMLANIASIEIPPLTCTYLEWLRAQSTGFLAGYGVEKQTLHRRGHGGGGAARPLPGATRRRGKPAVFRPGSAQRGPAHYADVPVRPAARGGFLLPDSP